MFVIAVNAIKPESMAGIVKWSAWANKPSGAGQNVTIGAGEKVLMDASPPTIDYLRIDGVLVIDPRPDANIKLDASLIIVSNGGKFFSKSSLG